MWVRSPGQKDPWRRKRQLTPVFLPGNSMDRGAWRATAHGVTKSWTQPGSWTTTIYFISHKYTHHTHSTDLYTQNTYHTKCTSVLNTTHMKTHFHAPHTHPHTIHMPCIRLTNVPHTCTEILSHPTYITHIFTYSTYTSSHSPTHHTHTHTTHVHIYPQTAHTYIHTFKHLHSAYIHTQPHDIHMPHKIHILHPWPHTAHVQHTWWNFSPVHTHNTHMHYHTNMHNLTHIPSPHTMSTHRMCLASGPLGTSTLNLQSSELWGQEMGVVMGSPLLLSLNSRTRNFFHLGDTAS